MTTATTTVDWHLQGDWFDVCSCKLPCPCSFAQEPTHGDCLFTLVWHVRDGYFGSVDLGGLNVVSLGEFTGNMWVGDPNAKMRLMFYIDESADDAQRDALERIFTGKEGGWPAQFASLIEDLRGIEYAPISFDAADDLAYWRAEIPGKVDLRVAALTGPTADPTAASPRRTRRVLRSVRGRSPHGASSRRTRQWASTSRIIIAVARASTSPSTGDQTRIHHRHTTRSHQASHHASATPDPT